MPKTSSRPNLLLEFALLAGLILLALIPRLFLLFLKGFEVFHADHAIFGLMAKHILEGKLMVYYYGQGYMGPLDSFVAALIFPFLGMNIFSIQLAPNLSYLLFLIANFYLLRKAFGLEVSLVANSLLALSPGLTYLSTTQGGYPEISFLGSVMLFALLRFSETGKERWLFLAGLLAGLAFWTNNLILLYFFALAILVFLRSGFWRRAYPASSPRRILLLEYGGIPALVRIAGIAVHAVIMGYLLWNLLSFFTGETLTLGDLSLKMASPPFHVKKLKKILLLLGAEIALLVLAQLGFSLKKLAGKLRPFLPAAGGYTLGSLPTIIYSLVGGEGYRMIHGSGMILVKELPEKFRLVVWEGFVNSLVGVPTEFLKKGAPAAGTVWAVTLLSLVTFLFLYFFFLHRKELGALLRLKPYPYSPSLFGPLLVLIVLWVCLFNNLEGMRYLYPSYFGVSLIFGLAIARLRLRTGILSGALLMMLLGSYGLSHVRFLRSLPDLEKVERGHETVLKFLKERGIQGAYAHYVTSYVLTFQSREEIIVAPYRSPDRFPKYTHYVDGLGRVAYLFGETDVYLETFQKILDQNKISYEKVWVEPFWIFVIDRRARSEKGLV